MFRTSRLLVAGAVVALLLAACDDSSESVDASDATVAALSPTTVAASSTTTTIAAVELTPEEVARDFLDALGTLDADRALAYLTDDVLAAQWGSADDLRMLMAYDEATGAKTIVTSCQNQGDSAEGTMIHCAYDTYGLRADEMGRGPFGGNAWDFVVRDGKITSAVPTFAFLTNGFSAQMWEPFQAWVASTHPEDLQAMYQGMGPLFSEESIRLWEERTKEWVETVNASSQ
jgi:hypothetical protein